VSNILAWLAFDMDYEIDGTRFSTLEEFYDEVSRVLR
jgi:hypothetical protein